MEHQKQPATVPVIIDTDPGIDDALAIMLALASPELDVRALTTVGGNASIEVTTHNALRLLHLCGRDDIPVGAGAEAPLVRRDSSADEAIHGADGFGGVHIEPAPRQADSRPAVQVIADLVTQSAEPITLIALGPLTNVAALIAAYPDVAARLARIVIMGGGARVLGNMTPAAEFNMWFDPEAAARVFDSGLPITMVGLDVTHQALTAPGDWDALREPHTGPVAQAVLGMVDFYTDFYQKSVGTDSTAQHDSLAVATVIQPDLIETVPVHVAVEYTGGLTRGMTVVDLDKVSSQAPTAEVAMTVAADAFNALLVERIVDLDRRIHNGRQ